MFAQSNNGHSCWAGQVRALWFTSSPDPGQYTWMLKNSYRLKALCMTSLAYTRSSIRGILWWIGNWQSVQSTHCVVGIASNCFKIMKINCTFLARQKIIPHNWFLRFGAWWTRRQRRRDKCKSHIHTRTLLWSPLIPTDLHSDAMACLLPALSKNQLQSRCLFAHWTSNRIPDVNPNWK